MTNQQIKVYMRIQCNNKVGLDTPSPVCSVEHQGYAEHMFFYDIISFQIRH